MAFFYECAGYFVMTYIMSLLILGVIFYFVGKNKKKSTKTATKVLWLFLALGYAILRTMVFAAKSGLS